MINEEGYDVEILQQITSFKELNTTDFFQKNKNKIKISTPSTLSLKNLPCED